VATIDQWDKDPWVINTPGGVVDLRTGKLREHRIDDYMTKIAAASPGGDCPRWKEFLKQITDGNEDLQRYLQRIAGYSLTGNTREQELYFFWGTGNNGKSVWVLVISGILNDYHVTAPIETFTASKFDRHPTELAKLHSARLVTAAETEEGRRWNEARIKELTGGDKVSGRFMRQDFFDFIPQFKLLFLGNHMPTLRIVNKAITRRFNRIPFNVTIADDQVNKNLAAEFKAQEGPGILAWAIEGCLEWQRIGMCPPKVVTDATEAYLESQDVLGEWMGECWEKNAFGFISATEAFASWQPWAEARQEWVGSVKTLSARLEDRGLRKGRNKEQTKQGFLGWRLKEPPAKPTKVLLMHIENETFGGNGANHEGAVLVSLNHEKTEIWLPKSQIKVGEARDDGRVEITMPLWLAERKGLDQAESASEGEQKTLPEDEIPF
jgi:putative DNA primase/helicase